METIEESISQFPNDNFKKLLQQFQKSFRIIQQCVQMWKDAMLSSQKVIESLQNFSEQFNSCRTASGSDVISKVLPDVREKLLYKITLEIDLKLQDLHNVLKSLKGICDRISKQNGYCISVYDKGCVDFQLMVMRTATSPSCTEMLEWIQDTETSVLHQYFIKKQVLERYDLQDSKSQEQLNQWWDKGDKDMINKIEEHLTHVQYILSAIL